MWSRKIWRNWSGIRTGKNASKKEIKKVVEIFEKTVDKLKIILYNSPCVPMKDKTSETEVGQGVYVKRGVAQLG